MKKREIKFRFFTPDKRMLMEHEGWTEGIGINEALHCSSEYGYVIMQYTGLQDRNGKEIYEGDILTISGKEIVAVEWDGQVSGFSSRPEIKYAEWGWCEAVTDHMNKIEVIGNIYENSGLLG